MFAYNLYMKTEMFILWSIINKYSLKTNRTITILWILDYFDSYIEEPNLVSTEML